MASIWDIPGTVGPQSPPQYNAGAQSPPGQSLYYNGGGYGQSQNWYNSPVSGNIRETNPELAYASYGSRAGVGDNNTTFSRWFQQQYPRFQRAHGQAIMDNPTMTMDQFLATLPQQRELRAEYESQSPLARGAQYSQFGPPARWIPR
jgi:hypothetical protein